MLRKGETAGELNAAIVSFRKSASLFHAGRFDHAAAETNLEIGDLYFMLSKFSNALDDYRQAIKLSGNDLELQSIAFSRMARTYATIGDQKQADKYSSQALGLSPANTTARAGALEAQGDALTAGNDLKKSIEPFSQAQVLFEKQHDVDGEARAILGLAYGRNGSGEAPDAIQLARRALRMWSAEKNARGAAQAFTALGMFAAFAGDWENSQCNYSRALPVFQKITDSDNEAIVLNGIGYVSHATGATEDSLRAYERARLAFSSVADVNGTIESIGGMGAALKAMGRFKPLLQLYKTKLQLARQTGNAGLEGFALADMAEAYELEHNYSRAEQVYRQALDAYRSIHHTLGEGDVLMRMGRLQAAKGEYAQAIPLLQNALLLKEKTGQVELVAEIQYEMASAYSRLNRLEEARAAIEKTIEIIESQRLRIAQFDSRAAYFASVHRYYGLYIQVLMLLHQQHPEQGFARLAFEASERSKVRALLDLLTNSSQSSSCEELIKRELAAEPAVSFTPDTHPQDHAGDDGGSAASSAHALSLQEVQAEIGDNDVLVEYALGDEKSYLWVVDRNGITSHELPASKQIKKLAQAFRDGLIFPQPRRGETVSEYLERERSATQAYRLGGRALSRVLLGPLALAEGRRVLIVPDGYLQYIPFSALPLRTAGGEEAFFPAQHEVVVLPSASALAAVRMAAAKRDPPTSGVAILADPVFERAYAGGDMKPAATSPQRHSPALRAALADTQGSQHIVGLPGSRREALAIQKALGPQNVSVSLGYDATRESVVNGSLSHNRVLHFATHGIMDPRHPENSGLILSLVDRHGKQQNGYLLLGDIYKLKLSADLVVLSSCESALGKELESEGMIGLPRGFLYAGARSVIASLWKVDDDATAALMKGLYKRMQHGESASAALRGAQLEMLKGQRYSRPYYWAAFVLEGDYQ